MRKPYFCICKNQDAGHLFSLRKLYSPSSSLIRSHFLWPYSPVCIGPGRKPEALNRTWCRVGIFSGHIVCCCYILFVFLSTMFVIANTLTEKLRAYGSNMRAHVVHALYFSFFFCNTPLIWLCMKAVAKN